MKALILVGGYGTRLRPLTLSIPKPLISFCNKSIVEHQVAALVEAGVKHVILAVAYQPHTMMSALRQLEDTFKIRVSCSREEEPLGTAGPIRLAQEMLMEPDGDDGVELEDEDFFVCNSDVICEFPLANMLKFHRSHRKEGTILVTKVENPTNYGVVVSEPNGKIQKFVEKPKEFVGDCINAGLYILKKRVIKRIEPRPTSIEKEIFPAMASDGELFCHLLDGYWADIGQPKDYLVGMQLYLKNLSQRPVQRSVAANGAAGGTGTPVRSDAEEENNTILSFGPTFIGNVLVHPSAKIGEGCCIGPDVTIGPDCVIGDGVRIKESAILHGCRIKDFAWLNRSIVGWQSTVGKWVRVEGLTVVGEDVNIANECFINGAFVLPHKSITQSVMDAGSIIM